MICQTNEPHPRPFLLPSLFQTPSTPSPFPPSSNHNFVFRLRFYFQLSHRRQNMQYFSFCVWLISCNMIWCPSVPSIWLQMTGFLSFLWLNSIPLCISATFSLSIHLLIDSIGWFHISAIVNSAAINISGAGISLIQWFHVLVTCPVVGRCCFKLTESACLRMWPRNLHFWKLSRENVCFRFGGLALRSKQ